MPQVRAPVFPPAGRYTADAGRRVDKGTMVVVPITAINRSKALWGADADEFKYALGSILVRSWSDPLSHTGRPERWANIPDTAAVVPGVWAHQLSFSGGPRACIGYRFAVTESVASSVSLVGVC